MKQRNHTSTFRPEIEGLRGIAVLIVVAFHSGIPGFTGGFLGVDVFFVLSGYLITGLLVDEIERKSRLNLLEFYARRARRLLPASALTLAATLIAGTAILAPQELAFAGRAARATAVYLSNVFFSINAADYFSPDVESNPMLHTWSLAVEEQFYLFWPLLIMLGLQFWKSKKALLVVLSTLTLASLATSVWFAAQGGTFAFYQLPARAWEFGMGGLAVLIPRGKWALRLAWWPALGWLGLLGILGSTYFVAGGTKLPGWIGLVPVTGTILALIAAAELPHSGPCIVLDAAPLQTLGTLSYSWYLWHWPFLVFAAALVPNISIPSKAAVAVASLGFAAVTHTLVENPIRFHPSLIYRPGLSLFFAGIVTVCSLIIAFLSIRIANRLADAPEIRTITAAVNDISRMPRANCVNLGVSDEVKTCAFGDQSASIHIVLFGDSHAIQWFNPLERLSVAHQWKLTTVVKSGCPANDVRTANTSSVLATQCADWRAAAIRQIVAMNPSLVVLGNATTYIERQDTPREKSGVSVAEWEAGMRRTLQALASAGLHVAIVHDNPLFTFDVPTCLARHASHSWYPGGSCDIDQRMALNPAVLKAEEDGIGGMPNVRLIDLTERFCHAGVCHAVQEGTIVYRDDNHLTGSFADILMPVLEAELSPVVRKPY